MKPPIHGRAKTCTTPLVTQYGTLCLVCGRHVNQHAGYEHHNNPRFALERVSTRELAREIARRIVERVTRKKAGR